MHQPVILNTEGELDAAAALPCKWKHCSDVFSTEEALLNHIYNQHTTRTPSWWLQTPNSKQKPLYFCRWADCAVVVNKRDHLVSHVRVHIDVRPYMCSVCSKNFRRPQDLKKHLGTSLHEQRVAAQANVESELKVLSANNVNYINDPFVEYQRQYQVKYGQDEIGLNDTPAFDEAARFIYEEGPNQEPPSGEDCEHSADKTLHSISNDHCESVSTSCASSMCTSYSDVANMCNELYAQHSGELTFASEGSPLAEAFTFDDYVDPNPLKYLLNANECMHQHFPDPLLEQGLSQPYYESRIQNCDNFDI